MILQTSLHWKPPKPRRELNPVKKGWLAEVLGRMSSCGTGQGKTNPGVLPGRWHRQPRTPQTSKFLQPSLSYVAMRQNPVLPHRDDVLPRKPTIVSEGPGHSGMPINFPPTLAPGALPPNHGGGWLRVAPCPNCLLVSSEDGFPETWPVSPNLLDYARLPKPVRRPRIYAKLPVAVPFVFVVEPCFGFQ